MAGERKRSLIDIVSGRFPHLDREQIGAAILFGDILVAGERCREPKRLFRQDVAIEVRGELFRNAEMFAKTGTVEGTETARAESYRHLPLKPFVSRGGEKLDAVLERWHVPVAGRVWLDAGCSTGGFSHALLLRGASTVHAVDVGYNVLDWQLRQLPQVKVHERTNIMGVDMLNPPPQAAVADLSFRSMEGPAQKILSLCSDNELYALIKPQFERKYLAGSRSLSTQSDDVEAGVFEGIVSDSGERLNIVRDLALRLARHRIIIECIAEAGLRGRAGNQEYIALLKVSGLDEQEIAASGLSRIAEIQSEK